MTRAGAAARSLPIGAKRGVVLFEEQLSFDSFANSGEEVAPDLGGVAAVDVVGMTAQTDGTSGMGFSACA
jgi:hypothetical protein